MSKAKDETVRTDQSKFPTGRHDGNFVGKHDYKELEVQLNHALYTALERNDTGGAEMTRGELQLLNMRMRRDSQSFLK